MRVGREGFFSIFFRRWVKQTRKYSRCSAALSPPNLAKDLRVGEDASDPPDSCLPAYSYCPWLCDDQIDIRQLLENVFVEGWLPAFP